MDLGWALLIWLVVAVIVFVIARNYKIRAWSAFALALLVASIVLGIVRPANTVAWGANQNAGLAGLYWLIMFLTPLILIIYIVSKAVTDTEGRAFSRF